MPVVDGSAALGTITVLDHRTEAAAGGATRLLVDVEYQAAQGIDVRPDAWFAVPVDGAEAVGRPAAIAPALEPATLAAGGATAGWLEFEIAPNAGDLFLDYRDASGATIFSVALF